MTTILQTRIVEIRNGNGRKTYNVETRWAPPPRRSMWACPPFPGDFTNWKFENVFDTITEAKEYKTLLEHNEPVEARVVG